MPAPAKIADLVKRFEENREVYTSGGYNETQIRREFIDPFFKELGWDIDNEQGYAEAYKDVIHEDAIKVGAPDYCFRIGGARKFFIEAKKPAVNLKDDIHPAFQLRRYAWSAKLPLSVLTDFEEFAVYDCRVKPSKIDKASNARIKYYTYKDYLEKWDEIAGIFSRDAVLKGAFDKYASSSKGRKGTDEVDRAFLSEIQSWRRELAVNIAHLNPTLTNRELNFVVQRMIDRIIFLRICEDRGIEDYGTLLGLCNGHGVYERLFEVFEKADQRYNSGIFHFHPEKDRREPPDELSPTVKIDDQVLKEIFKNIYYPESSYEFSVLPVEILGQVYEQFLGEVIHLDDNHRAVIELKPEVKKAGGVYYTPAYIVEYIVKNTVGKLVDGKTPRQVAKLRVLDAACGSGSFLIGAYQYLLDWHCDWYVKDGDEKWFKGKQPVIYQHGENDWRLTVAEKKRILINNIFGVDIDSQAVEVTKLSLLLKVLEGENGEAISKQYRFLHERVLPDLGENIKCGNSLIGSDIYSGAQAKLWDDNERLRVNAFDWDKEFPEVMKAGGFDAVIGNPPYIRIQVMKEWAPREVEFYKERYKSAESGNYDIYVVFVEKALSLLAKTGRLGFILPHKFFNAKYGEPLRGIISSGKHLSHVVHFGDQQVFDGATTYTCLMFLDKTNKEQFSVVKVSDLRVWRAGEDQEVGFVSTKEIKAGEWNFTVGKESGLVRKMADLPNKLASISEKIFQGLVTSADPVYLLDPLASEKDGFVHVRSNATGKEYVLECSVVRPLCKGSRDIRRYNAIPSKRVVFPYDPKISAETGKTVLIPEDEFCLKFPKVWEYLQENLTILRDREKGKMRHAGWYGYVYPKSVSLFARPKILTPSIAASASFTLDCAGELYFVGSGGGGGGGYGITLKADCQLSENYVLGLLNSKILDWYLKQISSRFRGGYFAYNRQYIEQLPIRLINFAEKTDKANHDRIVFLVESMLSLNKQLVASRTDQEKIALLRQIDATDNEIDQLVYKLYGLSEEEIGIVENSCKA